MNSIVRVAVAVIRNKNGQVFVAQRPDNVHQGGLWEFPGGKVESGETVLEALKREIKEEIGISVKDAQPLIKISYQYPDKHVLLDVWEVLRYSGNAHGKEGQPCNWVESGDLGQLSFPAANRPIISAVQLPAAFLVTPEPGADRDVFLENLERSVSSGIRWLLFRARTLSSKDYITLAQKVCQICEANAASVMLTADPQTVKDLGAKGLHLSAKQLMEISERPVGEGFWLSASCHNAEEVEQANIVGADFIFTGSVKQTASHENIKPIGWGKFSRLTEIANMPVYAIGGMTKADQQQSRAVGGQGIAAIRAFWS